jgi:tRNA(Ile)-lysidine synthase
MKAEQIVRRTIQDHDLISAGDVVVLGLSGGPDSLCLLHVLAELRSELGFSLSCVHVNHLMRGEKASQDEAWLTSYCLRMQVPLFVAACDVRALAKKDNISVEEAGRRARHDALFTEAQSITRKTGSRVRVAFAHNKDDQAETVLMRLLRGTGVHGLAAMEYLRADGMIRPLLDTPRKEIEAYCLSHDLSPRWDCTNASREFTRNRLRLDLIPQLEAEYNPNLKDGLTRLSNNAREDDAFLERLAQEKLAEYLQTTRDVTERQDTFTYPIQALAALDPAVGKRLIKQVFLQLGLAQDIGYTHLNALWEALHPDFHGAVIEFAHGYKAELCYGSVIFRKGKEVEGDFCIDNFWTLSQTLLPRQALPDLKALPPTRRALDADKVKSLDAPLVLRTRLPGDHIQPLGCPGTKKLQDYFVDAKVPKDLRDKTPLVCSGSQVLWVFNGPVNERFKVTEDTQTVILLDIQREIC